MKKYFHLIWNTTNMVFLFLFTIILSFAMLEDKKSGYDEELVYSIVHPLGTDANGNDKLLELSSATFKNVSYAFFSLIPFLCIGISFGIVLGYVEKQSKKPNKTLFKANNIKYIFYWIAHFITNIIQSIPIALVVIIGALISERLIPSSNYRIYFVMALFGVFSIPGLVYSIEDEIKRLKKLEFIQAAKALGVSKWRLIFVDLLWHSCRHIILIRTINLFLSAVAIEIFLSFARMMRYTNTLGVLLERRNYELITTIFICMMFISLRGFVDRIAYEIEG